MKFALVISEVPPYNAIDNPQELAYHNFLHNIPQKAPPTKNTEKIGEHVYLIPLA
ncbi:MAG TPA: hypothetical protein VH595_10520 [Verrucomicrobiae bacterium]|nr:hypothetical protein [Verrucomicrobiae bacterium]